MGYRGILLIAFLWPAFLASCSPKHAGPRVRRFSFWSDVIVSHRISGSDRVKVASRKAADAAGSSGIDLEVEIGPTGGVRRVEVERGGNRSGADAAPAIAAVRKWRFRPFEIGGTPVIAVGSVNVVYQGPELWEQPDAPMPAIHYDRLSIVLQRGACLGSCPDYRVEITGDGTVVFTTRAHAVVEVPAQHLRFNNSGVLVPGRHVSHVDRAELDGLIAQFREAHFFGLKDCYRAEVMDAPGYALTFQSGDQRKQVVDYLGAEVGMPAVVTALEDEVDRLAGTRRWVTGDAATGAALASEGFDFASPAAQALLVDAIFHAPEELILDLIARGAPLEAVQQGPPPPEKNGSGTPATGDPPLGQFLLEQSVRYGRPAVFQELERRGWLRRTPMPILTRAFTEGGGGCSPAIAQALVDAGVDPAARTSEGKTALMTALDRYSCGRKQGRNLGLLASALIRLGVPVNAVAGACADDRDQCGAFELER